MSLTIATFNLRSRSFTEDGTDTGERSWYERLDAAADYVIRTGASLVALQEVDFFPAPRQSQELAARLFELTGRPWTRLEDTSRPGSFIYDTSVVTQLAGGDAAHSVQVDPAYSGVRWAVWAQFSAVDVAEPFWVIRAHLPTTTAAPAPQRPAMYQAAATILADRADTLANTTGNRVIILGDFNHESLPQATLTERGYTDIRALAPSVMNGSLRSFNAWDPTMTNRRDGKWIDGIFLSDGWDVESAGLVAKYASGGVLPLAVPLPSDHMPIVATIKESQDEPGPTPDPVPLSKDPRQQLLVCDMVTGDILSDVTSLVSSCSWSVSLNADSRIDATFPLAHLPRARADEVRALLAEGSRFLAVTSAEHVVAAGQIRAATPNGTGRALQVKAYGLGLDERTVVDAAVVNDIIDGVIDDGLSVQRSVLAFQNLTLGTIAKRIVQNTLQMPGGTLPIVFGADEIGTDTRSYDGFKLPNLAAELDQIRNAAGGPDIEFRPRFAGDGDRIEFVLLTGTAADPLLHQDGSDWVWDATVVRGPVVDIQVAVDASMRTNFAWTTGTGQDTALRISPRTNNADWQRGYPLRESVGSYPDVLTWAELHRLGEARIRQGSRPVQTWTATLRPESPPLGLFRPGDWCRLHVADHLWIADGAHRVRIGAIAGAVGSELVAVTFLPRLEAR